MASISVPTAIGLSTAVSAGTGLIGSALQKGAVDKGAAAALAAQQQQQTQTRQDLLPFMTGGTNALKLAGDLSGANGPDAASAAMANFTTSPGYQFQMDQGLKAIGSAAAAGGAYNSGERLKAEQTFGSNLAASDFATYYNRLFDLSKLGEGAAASEGTIGQSNANAISGIDTGAANADSSIIGDAAKGISGAVSSGLTNYAYLNQLGKKATTNAVPGGGMSFA